MQAAREGRGRNERRQRMKWRKARRAWGRKRGETRREKKRGKGEREKKKQKAAIEKATKKVQVIEKNYCKTCDFWNLQTEQIRTIDTLPLQNSNVANIEEERTPAHARPRSPVQLNVVVSC